MEATVQLYDRDGTLLGDMSEARLDRVINGIEEQRVDFDLPYSHPILPKIDLGNVEMGVFLGGNPDPYFHGVVWNDVSTSTDPRIRFVALDLSSKFESRYVEDDLSWVNVDQHIIAWNILQHAQSQPGGDLRIESGFSASGYTRDRHLKAYDHPNVGKILHRFRSLQNGFDWWIKVYGDGRREWQAAYPKRGSYDPKQVIEWGKNITEYTLKRDGTTFNDAICFGEGEGPARVEARYTDTAARDARGLSTKLMPKERSVTELSTVQARAEGFVNAHKDPPVELDVTIKDHEDLPILDLVPGDERRVRIIRGAYHLDEVFLITEIEVHPDRDTAKLTVELL
jgi:hypothetical protein